jgi:drug/metabolite transporter (DMT)-like permease
MESSQKILHPVVRASYTRGVVLVALSTVTWGSGGLFIRLLPLDLGTIVFWRGLFAVLFIGLFLIYRFGSAASGVFRGLNAESYLIVVCSSAAVILFPAAVQRTSVANAFTILAALPFFAAAIAWLWMRERPSGLTMIASTFALFGIIIMLRPTTAGPTTGDFLAILGTIAQGGMTVAIRRNPDVEILPLAWLSVALSAVVAIPLAENLWSPSAINYFVLAGFALVPMTFGMMLYMIGSALIPSTLAALIGTLEAPIGALWAWIGVGEVPATATLIGGSIVFASVFCRLLVEQLQVGPSHQ